MEERLPATEAGAHGSQAFASLIVSASLGVPSAVPCPTARVLMF